MKKLILVSTGFFLVLNLIAQAPDYFHYQAVLRNSDGTLMANIEVSVQVELIQGSIDGTSIYLENHSVQTNERGMVILKIGDGTFFNEIDWESGPYFLSISVDGEHLGTSQLLSVPYALYAKKAGFVHDDDSDSTNEIQTLSINNTTLAISGGNSILLPDVVTPWQSNDNGIHYYRNVGIMTEDKLPNYPIDIVRNISGQDEYVFIRLQNLDEGGKAATSLALEAYEDKFANTFFRSELIQTSSYYTLIPDFTGMTALIAGGNGISLCSKSDKGSLRFYTTIVQDTIVERARIDPAGNMGIGTQIPKSKLHVTEGDIYIEDVNRGVIMQSPDGRHWRFTVNNDGELRGTEVSIK